jgi:hypothetical protein
VLLGFWLNTPREIFEGIQKIVSSPDTLITDYIAVGGVGAALVNSGCLTLIVLLIFYWFKLQVNGVTIACLFTITGFALFGKNLFNIWFIIAGAFLYIQLKKESWIKLIYPAFFGTALAPVVTEVLFSTNLPLPNRFILAITSGLGIGFILLPISANLLKVHNGFNLYNMGFTAGVVGTIVVSLFNSYGIVPEPKMLWTSGNNKILGYYLFLMVFSMIVTGIFLEKKPWQKLQNIWKYSGQLITDFVLLEGFGASLINMGINGCIVTLYVLLVGGSLNGPTVGGIFTVIGFSAFGKHPKNILPILMGICLGGLSKKMSINEPSMLLAALFGTTLAPIAGKYGWLWGTVAGFIHSSVVQSVGVLHGGLNLYNNGFAAGIVAAILIPIIEAFTRRKDIKPPT